MPLCVMPGRALDVCAGLLENIVSFAEGGKSIGMFLRNTLANHAQFSDVINVCTGSHGVGVGGGGGVPH